MLPLRSQESERITKILDAVARFAPPVGAIRARTGLADLDDGAVLPLCDDTDLVVCSDFVRGTGFDLFQLGLLTWADIGFYLVGANASDLAAMGASPLGILTVLRYSSEMSDGQYEAVVSGIAEACARFELPLLGGDTGSSTTCVLSASALGTCRRGRALLRAGGSDGDSLYLTGTVGTAAAAMAYFKREVTTTGSLDAGTEERLLVPWKRVEPALAQGAFLSAQGLSMCAIDTSDGLAVSCHHLAQASALDVVLSAAEIPTDPETRMVAELLKVEPLHLALTESVDFRLLFAVHAAAIPIVEREFSKRQWPLFPIGTFRRASPEEPTVWLSDGVESRRLQQGFESRLRRSSRET